MACKSTARRNLLWQTVAPMVTIGFAALSLSGCGSQESAASTLGSTQATSATDPVMTDDFMNECANTEVQFKVAALNAADAQDAFGSTRGDWYKTIAGQKCLNLSGADPTWAAKYQSAIDQRTPADVKAVLG